MEESGTTRLETFSDGVFAIAATLLVLEFTVTAAKPLTQQLLDLWPSYLAFATSFLTIGIIWINHHAVFERIARSDRVLLFVNTVFLMIVSFIPFPTRLVAEFLQKRSDERAAVIVYGLTFSAMAILYSVLWFYAALGRRLIGETVPQERVDEITRSFLPGPFVYAAATGLAFASPVASVAIMLGLAIFYVPSGSLWIRSGR